MTASERLVVGRIAKAHGIRGEVVVVPLSDRPERFDPGAEVLAGDDVFTIEAARPHHDRLLVKFREIPDRNAAEAARGTELTILAEDAAPLPEGSFYPHQLIGSVVCDEEGNGLGTLIRVDENPANDLWVVDHDGDEVLVPAVKQIIVSVDVDARRIVVSPPEGLFT